MNTRELHSSGQMSITGLTDAVSSLVERMPDPVLVADDEQRYLFANAAACQLLGVRSEEILGRRIHELSGPEFKDSVGSLWADFLKNGTDRGHYRLLRADGTTKDVEYTALANVSPGVHISFIRDVTEQKRSEQERIRSEQLARLALSAGRLGSWVWDHVNQTFSCNEMLLHVYGIEARGTVPSYEDLIALIHPDDRDAVRQQVGNALRAGGSYDLVYRLLRVDGSVRWIVDRGQAMCDASGVITGIAGVCWDTTEQKESEAALRLSEMRFRTLVEQSPLSTQVFNPDGLCISVNRAWQELWGAEPAQVVGYNILEDSQLAQRGVLGRIRQAFAGEVVQIPVIPYTPPAGKHEGKDVWVHTFLYPVKDIDGGISEVVMMQEDVSTAVRFERERTEHARELARFSAELQRFAYMASHDLKEPLRNITAFSELLASRCRTKLDEDERDYLNHILSGGRRMGALVDSILTYSRATVQRDSVFIPTDANELLQQALDNLRSTIADRHASISCHPLPTIRCAPLDITQVFQNLVGNAIKYCKETPTIEITAIEREDAWRFAIKDNGLGIGPKYHDQIFSVFTRLHGSEYSGTGVGLAICKAIVEKHGGRIWVESEEGQGATFLFTIPKQQS